MNKGAITSLDALYNLLLERKIMSVEEVAAHFNVSKELVIEWGKVLEAGELATITNPRIGKALIKLAGYTGEEQKKRLSDEEIIKKGIKIREDIIQTNKLIKNRNQGKIKEAKKLILKARQNSYDNEFIKKKFRDKNWPPKLIDDLLS